MKQIKDESSRHRKEFKFIISECTRREFLVYHFTLVFLESTEFIEIGVASNQLCALINVFHIETKDVPTGNDVHILFMKIPLECMKHLTLSLEAHDVCTF